MPADTTTTQPQRQSGMGRTLESPEAVAVRTSQGGTSQLRVSLPGSAQSHGAIRTPSPGTTRTDTAAGASQAAAAAVPGADAAQQGARNLANATEVFTQARAIYVAGHKSSNKNLLSNFGYDEARQQQAESEVRRIRESDDPGATAVGAAGHNCQELADLCAHLAEQAGHEVHVIGSGAHAFAVFGELSERGARELPNDMKQWPPHLAVCDPWTNIVCAARDYPDRFTAKMTKWDGKMKEINVGQGDWTRANDQGWINSVLDSRKLPLNA
ncbi:MAG TPA: hypothetical protein VF169_08760 [Albitalea sp.]|uniref:hypothetical protein n=1 Tax=Piscinibacter sp. TaxID=1903157 RepID=UPI002ED59EE5